MIPWALLELDVLGGKRDLGRQTTIYFVRADRSASGLAAAQLRRWASDVRRRSIIIGAPRCGNASLDGWASLFREVNAGTDARTCALGASPHPDEWQLRLFGQDAEAPEHDARHTLIETLQWEVASRALALGINVILDYGFWAREEREDFRARAKQLGARSEVHFLDVGEHELLRRLAQRNAQPSSLAFHIPEEMMRPWIAFFQKPTPDELQRRD